MSRKMSSARQDYWRKLIGEQSGSERTVGAFCPSSCRHGRLPVELSRKDATEALISLLQIAFKVIQPKYLKKF